MKGHEFAQFTAFVAVADTRNFARAAAHVGVTPSALSQTIRALEDRLGVRLLNRTTRSVSVTEAGQALLSRLRPALEELNGAVEGLNAQRGRPAGSLRINVPRLAAAIVIGPLVGRFLDAYPEIVLEVIADDHLVDIVAGRFDAGMRLGECLERDMIAIKVGGDIGLMAVAAPHYLARNGVPRTPGDLHRHRCINWRQGTSERLYRWEFEKGSEKMEVAVEGPLVTNDHELTARAVVDGVGIAYLLDIQAEPLVAEGKVTPVLEDWWPRFPGLYLYYPSRRQMPAALLALIGFLKGESSKDSGLSEFV